MKNLLLLALFPVFLTGCATLNKSECRNADWRMIGMEDGAKGLLSSNIGKHRQACAKFNITPNLEEYRRGYDEGVRQFCTKKNGYDLGSTGHNYNDVCPADMKDDFLRSYDLGWQVHSRQMELQRTDNDIQSGKNQIERIRDEIKEKKEQLISDQSTKEERADLLNEIEELQDQIKGIEKKVHQAKRDYELQQEEFQIFQEKMSY